MSRKKLKNAPLKEAIFELSWSSPISENGLILDKEFELALGKFHNSVTSEFPVFKKIIPSIPNLNIYGQPHYQFWQRSIEWPVIQLGPGILTVNDTDKNYEWEATYRPNILKALRALRESYTVKPNFNKIVLKYIDSIDIPEVDDIYQYIEENLQTTIRNNYELPSKTKGVNFIQSFFVNDSQVVLAIQTAVNNINQKPALVWITSVEKQGNIEFDNIHEWLDMAHTITSDLFVKMLKPGFYATFDE